MGGITNIHLLEEERAFGDYLDHDQCFVHDDSCYDQEQDHHSLDCNTDHDEDDESNNSSHESQDSAERTLYWEAQESLLQEIVEQHRSSGSKLRQEITGIIEMAKETNLCRCVKPKSDGGCRKCLRKRVVSMLCCKGLNATLCTSKWTPTSKFPGGTHEYIEVTACTQSRKKQVTFLIELEFQDEFKLAKACDEYHHLIMQLPEMYIGKAEHLTAIVRVVCDAAKRSTMEKRIHLGPWRKTSFMQKKWSASSRSNSSSSSSSSARQVHMPIVSSCFAVEVV